MGGGPSLMYAARLGFEVGDRTLLDVLNAENDHARATLALAEARVDQVVSRLRLAALADRLGEALLGEVNAGLAQTPRPPQRQVHEPKNGS
jgi:outer membrane protein